MLRSLPKATTSPSSPSGQTVSQWTGAEREHAVQRMFTAIARYYDLNNSLLSFGLHHRWKRATLAYVPARPGGCALDLGAGTADLALLLDERLARHGHVTAMDLNFAMLREGMKKIIRRGATTRILCCQGNAERLTFQDQAFDVITAGFCIRNVGNRPKAFTEIHRVLKPGGRFVCLEFSRPSYGWLRMLYDWYSFKVLPRIGTWVSRDYTDVYQYLPASIRTFPDQDGLADLLRRAGFSHVEYHNLSGGIVAVHVAIK